MIDDVLAVSWPKDFASSWLVARDLAWAADLIPDFHPPTEETRP